MRQVGTVASGSAAGQLILLAATPLLARIFTPAEFGDYAVFLALYVITLVIACLRFEFAIPVATETMLPAVIQASLLASVGVGLAIGALAATGVVAHWLPGAGASLGWLAVCAPLLGIMQAGIYTSLRAGKFRSNVVVRVMQPASFVAFALAFPALGLIRSQILSVAVAAACAVFALAPYLRPVGWPALREALQRFRTHPLLSLPSTLLDTLSLACPIFVIAAAYGADVLGNYSQLQRLMAAPLFLLAIAIGEVFFKHAADGAREGTALRPLVMQAFWKLSGLAALIFVLALFIGSDFARVFLGPRWRTDTAFILLVLAPALVRMCVSPVTNVFIATGRITVATAWQAAYFVATYGLLPLFAMRLPIESFLLAYLALESVMYGIYLALALRVAARPAPAS